MPIKKLIPYLLIVIFVTGVVVFKTSTKNKSFSAFADANQSIYTNRGIVDRIIKIDISYKNLDENTQEITASVSVPFDYEAPLNYSWKLGENIQLISGDLAKSVENLKANQSIKIKIIVSGFVNTTNRHIGFEILGQKNDRRIYGDSLLASQMERTFENTVQNVEKLKSLGIGK